MASDNAAFYPKLQECLWQLIRRAAPCVRLGSQKNFSGSPRAASVSYRPLDDHREKRGTQNLGVQMVSIESESWGS